MAQWPYNDPNILEFKIEDLKKDPAASMTHIMDFFNLLDSREENFLFKYKGIVNRILHKFNLPFLFKQKKIARKDIYRIHDAISFKKLAKGRSFGEVDTTSHYRSGADGDWKNHFNEEHKAYFKEKYGQLLIKLGYEKNLEW